MSARDPLLRGLVRGANGSDAQAGILQSLSGNGACSLRGEAAAAPGPVFTRQESAGAASGDAVMARGDLGSLAGGSAPASSLLALYAPSNELFCEGSSLQPLCAVEGINASLFRGALLSSESAGEGRPWAVPNALALPCAQALLAVTEHLRLSSRPFHFLACEQELIRL